MLAEAFILCFTQGVSARLEHYLYSVHDSCAGYEDVIEEAYLQAIDVAISARDLLAEPFKSSNGLQLSRLLFAGDTFTEDQFAGSISETLRRELEFKIQQPLCRSSSKLETVHIY